MVNKELLEDMLLNVGDMYQKTSPWSQKARYAEVYSAVAIAYHSFPAVHSSSLEAEEAELGSGNPRLFLDLPPAFPSANPGEYEVIDWCIRILSGGKTATAIELWNTVEKEGRAIQTYRNKSVHAQMISRILVTQPSVFERVARDKRGKVAAWRLRDGVSGASPLACNRCRIGRIVVDFAGERKCLSCGLRPDEAIGSENIDARNARRQRKHD